MPKPRIPFKNRSVVDIMVLAFTFTVVLVMISTGVIVLIVELVDSSAETTITQVNLFNLVSTMMGALLGILVGRSKYYQAYEADDEVEEVLDDE